MLRIIIEQSNWLTVRHHCNTFWHFIINFPVFGKSFLNALLKQNKIKIAVILCFLHDFLKTYLKGYIEVKNQGARAGYIALWSVTNIYFQGDAGYFSKIKL